MIELRKVKPEEKELLWNINQKYLYEMTNYYPDDMDENGNYHYGHFDAYFVEEERIAYFIYNDDVLVGFFMINPYSNLGHKPDHILAEFSIFPAYRRKHLGQDVARMILDMYPGKWEIKFNEKNYGAKKLWETLTEQYHPTVYHLNELETVLEFRTTQLH